MTEVSLADAYREACLALGESIVQQRLMGQELARLNSAALADGDDPAGPPANVAA